MNAVVKVAEPRLSSVQITEDEIIANLMDGRTISAPLIWSWRLLEATEALRQHFEILGDGQGIHWPDIDEDISVEGMLYGTPAQQVVEAVALARVGRDPASVRWMLSKVGNRTAA